MPLFTRRILDVIKGKVGNYFKLPSPPFGQPSFWKAVYRKSDPSTLVEWGELTLEDDLMEYDYRLRSLADDSYSEKVRTTFAETIGVGPNEEGSPIIILGCGYSRLGEDMAAQGWKRIVQLDVVSKVILDLSERCTMYDDTVMQCIEDDAIVLSAFDSGSMSSVVDKGLMDILFLGDEYDQVRDIMKTSHRVLRPSGILSVFSFSQPKYMLPKLLRTDDLRENPYDLWQSVEVRQLDSSILYRFKKSPLLEPVRVTSRPFITKRKHR